MGDEFRSMLIDELKSVRTALQNAMQRAHDTPRPEAACPAHDSLYALTENLAKGVDTLLKIKEVELDAAKPKTLLDWARAIWSESPVLVGIVLIFAVKYLGVEVVMKLIALFTGATN